MVSVPSAEVESEATSRRTRMVAVRAAQICLDPHGTLVGRADLPDRGGEWIRYGALPLRLADDGTAWVEARGSLVRLARDGRPIGELLITGGQEIGSFVLLPDGFVVSLFGPPRTVTPPRILRLGSDGSELWRVDLPSTMFRRPVESFDLQPIARTQPLLVSGGLVLASFEEDSGGMGTSVCLDLLTGKILWMSGTGPPASRSESSVPGASAVPRGLVVGRSCAPPLYSRWLSLVGARTTGQRRLVATARGGQR